VSGAVRALLGCASAGFVAAGRGSDYGDFTLGDVKALVAQSA
jgi:hypothetical protein